MSDMASRYPTRLLRSYVRVKVATDPKLQFPEGALELKASWRVVEAGDNTDGFFTTKVKIDRIKNVANRIKALKS